MARIVDARIYVRNATEKEIQIVHVDGDRLVDKAERIPIGTAGAASCALRIDWRRA